MKTTAKTAQILLAAAFILASSALFAQASTDTKQEAQKYRLYIVKEENGNKQVIDKTFTSKAELDKYVKENNIEAPEASLTEPPMPPSPPVAPKAPATGEKQHGKKADKKEKKIIIIEKTEGSNSGSEYQIDLSGLSSDEATKVIQEIINLNIAKVEVVHVNKEVKGSGNPELNNLNEEKNPKVGINDPTANNPANLANLKVYPNPGQQFHVECNVNKAADVKLSITDMQGHQVYELAMNNVSGKLEKDINAAGLSKGTYLMALEAGSERATTSVVLQ